MKLIIKNKSVVAVLDVHIDKPAELLNKYSNTIHISIKIKLAKKVDLTDLKSDTDKLKVAPTNLNNLNPKLS